MAARHSLIGIGLLVVLAAGAVLAPAPGGPLVHTVTLEQSPVSLALDRLTERVFVATTDASSTRRVTIFDTETGAVLRTVQLGAGPLTPSIAVDERARRAFVADRYAHSVRVLDAGSGALLRTLRVGRDPTTVLVDERAGHVVVLDGADAGIRLLDARTGAILRTGRLTVASSCTAVDSHTARAFMGSYDGAVRMVDTRRGSITRPVTLPTGISALGIDRRAGHVLVSAYGDNVVRMLDAGSGRLLRAIRINLVPDALVVDERVGRAFAVDYSRAAIAVLATTTGTVLRTTRLSQKPGPLIVDAPTGRAFVVSQAGDVVTVLDAHSGALLRTVALDHPLRSGFNWVDAVGTDEQRSHVFIASDRGTTARLAELDGHTGHVVQTIPLPVAPMALAVDGRAGRAVVAGSPIPQRSTLERIADTVRGMVDSAVPQLQGWSFPGAGSSTANVPGGVSVVDVSH